jgi:hypothetical protein
MLKKIFRYLDDKTFIGADQLKVSSSYQQALSPIESLPSEVQTYVNRSISILLPIIPIIIFLVLLLNNLFMRSDLSTKKELLQLIRDVKTQKAEVLSFERALMSPTQVSTKDDFSKRVQGLAVTSQINASLIQVKSYEQRQTGELNQSLAKVSFKNLSTIQLTTFLDQILIKEKVKIKDISIEKSLGLLKGTLDIIHFSKMSSIGNK